VQHRSKLPAYVVILLLVNIMLGVTGLRVYAQIQPCDDDCGGSSYEGVCTTCLGPEEFDCCEIIACGGPDEAAARRAEHR
jgi:hypothetical protein